MVLKLRLEMAQPFIVFSWERNSSWMLGYCYYGLRAESQGSLRNESPVLGARQGCFTLKLLAFMATHFFEGSYPVHHRIFSSIPALYQITVLLQL